MRKSDELGVPTSCWNKALDSELMFILLSRDDAAAATIRFWIDERLRLGKNKRHDKQIIDAENIALMFDGWHEESLKGKHGNNHGST